MQFAEVIYETGSKSVVSFESEEELIAGLKNHHERATKGEPGRGKSTERNDLEDDQQRMVQDYPAERIVRVLTYDKHPSELNEDMTMSSEVARKELDAFFKDSAGAINVMELAAAVRELANPVIDEAGKQESQYKMKETKELELDFV